jgi:iron complex outermembrane receptor protein
VGEPLRVNIPESFRQGVELEAGCKLIGSLSAEAQATLGRTRIAEYREVVADYDAFVNDTVVHRNPSLAYSPDVIARAVLRWEPVQRLALAWSGQYVGAQYLDNTADETRRLGAYWFSDFQAAYGWKTKWVREITLGVQVRNLFDRLYESNGYTYSYIYGGETVTENFYYPQAGRHVMGRVVLGF